MYDILIIGGGPAGLTAATYACRAGKSVLVLEKAAFGGQITWSPRVENFPGFVSISGNELGDKLLEQAMEQGAEVELEEITALQQADGAWRAVCDSGAFYEGRAVILATGAKPRMLGIRREEELVGSGVGYCAVCDGAFYKGKAVAVNGGGNSALQDALLLSESCSKVYLIHRRDEFRGAKILQDQVMENPKIEVLYDTVVNEIRGQSQVESLLIYNRKKEESSELPVDGVFIAVGILPNTEKLQNLPAVDEHGYIIAGEDTVTSEPGIFAAGDVRTKQLRQVITAAADGANAITSIQRYLQEHPEL